MKSKNSQMPSRYSHISEADSLNAFLALAGVKEVTDQIEEPSLLAFFVSTSPFSLSFWN